MWKILIVSAIWILSSMKAFMNTVKLVPSPSAWPETQTAILHDKHIQEKFIVVMQYGKQSFIQ